MNRLSAVKSSLGLGRQILGHGFRGSRILTDVRFMSSINYKAGDSLPHGWKVVKTTSVPELSLPGINGCFGYTLAQCSGDLNCKHLKSRNIWITNFYLFIIQMVCYSDTQYHFTRHLNSGPVFKWSEYWSINQMLIWIPNYHSTGHLDSEPLDDRTNPHDLNTELVCFSDPHCTQF